MAATESCYAPVANVDVVKEDGGANLDWACTNDSPSIKSQNVAVRLPVDIGEEGEAPLYLSTRQGLFDQLTLIAVDADGNSRSLAFAADDVRPEPIGSNFTAPLPEVTRQTTMVIAIYERPNSGAMLQLSALATERALDRDGGLKALLIITLMAGFLLMPVIFDLVFYRALREKFVLWHAAMAGALAVNLAFGGVILFVIPMSMPVLHVLSVVSFSVMTISGLMFSKTMIEPDKLHPRLRLALTACAIMAAAALALRFAPLEFSRIYGMPLYYVSYIPLFLVLAVCVANAWRHGSRAARFLALAWTPFAMMAFVRIGSYLTPLGTPNDAAALFQFAILFEIVVTSIAVTDRFVALRRQRDSALEEASLMIDMAEHDDLTGLYNRRALEKRFTEYRFRGFDTFALIDLDKFKQVNDTHGHAIGDQVLSAVGAAFEGHADRNIRTFRLGGEEFVVLLRGEQSLQRAEALRQMIPAQIAARVEGLSAPVTASMGAVEVPRDGLAAMQLSDLYARADQLLYEAKAGGRNRMVSEKLSLFGPSPDEANNPTFDRRSHRRTGAA